MNIRFDDTHCHLDYSDFDEDRDAAIRRAVEAGIDRIVVVGTDQESSWRAVELAARHPNLFAVVGWHPGHATGAPADFRPALRELARQPKVVALGETGLDFYRLPEGGDPSAVASRQAIIRRQESLFDQHLEVAVETGLNVVIHQRNSFAAILPRLRPYADRVKAVFHCFVGGPTDLAQVLELGSIVSFTGIATFKNAADVRESIAAVPADRFMLETDAPFLAPVPFRGKRCEPAHVIHTAQTVARVRGSSMEDLSAQTRMTGNRFFRGLGTA